MCEYCNGKEVNITDWTPTLWKDKLKVKIIMSGNQFKLRVYRTVDRNDGKSDGGTTGTVGTFNYCPHCGRKL
ncbi:hypothetical protein [Companilactobacillus nantensis]|uniref:hypothetical protein n=1 Tax=Companilactobacillus nantensis TaxID=305793 RepID=UPI00070A80CF|nr:hypothetical protein [Companilactobacillus nantensis]GEO64795.1 hypothetical protein LNA01_19780 [Companilactobacillus nantensis]